MITITDCSKPNIPTLTIKKPYNVSAFTGDHRKTSIICFGSVKLFDMFGAWNNHFTPILTTAKLVFYGTRIQYFIDTLISLAQIFIHNWRTKNVTPNMQEYKCRIKYIKI
jgi:hypothetical protein